MRMNAVVQPIFKPNSAYMLEHLEHLFGGYLDGFHDGLVELAWTNTKPDESGRYRLQNARLYRTDQLEELVDEACRLNAQPMCNVYIGAALRHPDTAPFGRAQDRDAWALTCLYVDLDDREAAAKAKNIYGPNKPTMVVLTGQVPHTRAQLWWRLTEPQTDPSSWPLLLRGLAGKLSGDPVVTNPSRVMRLAGSIAWPVKPGRSVELTAVLPLKEPGEAAYGADYMARVFPPAAKPEAVAPPAAMPSAPRQSTLLGMPPPNKGEFFRRVNDLALQNASVWVPAIFGAAAQYQSGTRAWRVSSHALGRPLEEDLSIAPNGIVDFGVHDLGDPRQGKRTPIDIMLEHGRAADAKAAAFTLCDLMSVRPEGLGWQSGSPTETQNQQEPLKAEVPAAPTGEGLEVDPIFVGDMTGDAKPRSWLVTDWIPAGVVTSISGDGGMGKTLLAQQLLYAAGVGGKWLGLDVPPTRGLGVFCEDDEDELHRRHNAIKADLGHKIGNPFTDTWIWPRVGFDNLLVTFDRDNRPTISPFFASVMRHVAEKKVGLLILDTIADLFGGNEVIRAQVNYFIKATCGAFIKKAKDDGFTLTVILLSHPSQAGRNSGTGESGSTAWNNAVRARLYLTRPEDGLPEQRTLTRKKSNYSASGDDVKIDLLWEEGVLKAAKESDDDRIAGASLEHQMVTMIAAAWEADAPFKGKKDNPKFLDTCMVETFGKRFDRALIVSVLNRIKRSEIVKLDRQGDRRGYRVPSMKNRSQPIEE